MNKRQKKKNLTTLVRGLEIGQGLIIGNKWTTTSKRGYHFLDVGTIVFVTNRYISNGNKIIECETEHGFSQDVLETDILIKRK